MATQVVSPQPRSRSVWRLAPPQLAPRVKALIALFVGIGLLTLVAPRLAPYDPAAIRPAERMLAPNAAHLLGTDMFGRDLLSRVLCGAPPTVQVALGAVMVGAIPGIALGLLAGRQRSLFDQLLTYIVDAWIALPGVLVALVLTAAFGRSLLVLTLTLGFSSIPMFYRFTRAETMRVAAEPFVEAARSLGAAPHAILWRHLLPNIAPSLIAVLTVSVGRMLLATSALSFIGLGAPPPSPEWGSLLAEGRETMEQGWWLMWFPGAAIALTTFLFYQVGNALRDG